MQVRDLIEILSDMEQDAEVRIAYQPNYPLYGASAGIVEIEEEGTPFVYIGCGDSDSGYLNGEVAEQGVFGS